MIQIAIVEDEEIYVKQLTFTNSWLNEKVTSTGLIMKPAPEMDLAVTFSRVVA